MSNPHPQTAGAGTAGGMTNPVPQQQPSMSAQPQTAVAQQNLNQIVLEYLSKKGYTKTEATLREESSKLDKDGRPIASAEKEKIEVATNEKYKQAFDLIAAYIESNLDIYKLELSRLLWPLFVYSYLEMVAENNSTIATDYFDKYKARFQQQHNDTLTAFGLLSSPAHVQEDSVSSLYRTNKYRLPLNTNAYFNLVTFLETNSKRGGAAVLNILQNNCTVIETQRGPIDQYSFEAIIKQARSLDTYDSEAQEGIVGGFTGVSNQDLSDNTAPIKLGVQPMEADLAGDVRAELEDEDARNIPAPGKPLLVEVFDQKIKREESADAIGRHEVPYPGSKARDVKMEVQKIKEYRDRFQIEGRTGGVAPPVSCCMFTFHNTLGTIICIEFSDDNNLVACGTEESYIRIWSLDGEPLTSTKQAGNNESAPSASRRLIGHSAAVQSVSFSPSSTGTTPKLLLSSSADGTIRLWCLQTWSCLIVYKGHHGPVWNVRWGPFGHYFVSGGWDKTVRVWCQDHITPVRLMVGHDTSVNQIAFHPNGAYVFSASDTVDKTVRMWSVTIGQCVRIFTGHTETISAMECAPDGKTLASADGAGTIILWDLAKGSQIKRMRGHGRGGIWSLSFSAESTVLVSGGCDGTVRLWDIQGSSDPSKSLIDGETIATGGQADATRISSNGVAGSSITGASAGGATGGGTTSANTAGNTNGTKKKGKERVITSDQISAFPTKKTPVYKVKFTRMNLVLASGCFTG